MKQILHWRTALLLLFGFSFSAVYGQITTFSYTGGMQTYVVPGGVTSIAVDLTAGGAGYSFPCCSHIPGNGSRITTEMTVTPGETLYIFVGGRGSNGGNNTAGVGGYNGGGTSGVAFSYYSGGGGGGASDIRRGGTGLVNRAAVAGGGGGSAYNYGSGDNGGHGGGLTGAHGLTNFSPGAAGGGGGSQVSGGSAGVWGGYSPGTAGSLGNGGNGGPGTSGAGGGAGYYGGGGGAWGGGGGGSDWSDPGICAPHTSYAGINTGNGTIIIEVLCAGLETDVSAVEVCEGEEITLSAVSTTGGVVTWDGGVVDGDAFTPPLGLTTYTATSTSDEDCLFSIDILVYPTPDVTVTATSVEICDDQSVTFSGGGADSYTYDPVDVVDGDPYTPGDLGTTTYTITGILGPGCESTATIDVLMNPTPVVTATASEIEICEFETVTFSEGGDADSYEWDPADIVTGVPYDGLPDGAIVVTLTGTFDATGCDTDDMVSITVNPSPYVNASSGDENYCDGETVILGAGGDADVWVWDPTDLEPGIGTTTYTLTGTYEGIDCETVDEVTITMHDNPTVTASADYPDVCNGQNVVLTGGGATTYEWDMGVMDGEGFAPGAVGAYTYTVVGTDVNDCSDEATIEVTVVEEITITYVVTDEMIFEDGEIDITVSGGVAPYTFDWDIDGTGDFDDTEDQTGLADALYNVVVNGASGCSASEMIVTGTQAGVTELNDVVLNIYPNPATEFITVEFEGTFTYELTDINGAIIAQATATDKEVISLEDVADGVYFVMIKSDDSVHTAKVVKK
ncbi:MAG: T9SS type A sorting domain-containing protein [Crocinitomix sp.]|nr:T9SS type A sorting domain-containing protein [Crocinitomix sp.]